MYAQPLVVTDVNWQNLGPIYTIVYVVTENDTVYAIDGTNCHILNPGGTGLPNNDLPNQTVTMTAVNCHTIGGKTCSPANPSIGVLQEDHLHVGIMPCLERVAPAKSTPTPARRCETV